jgi:uncharacterized integral membrane protein
MRYVYLALIVLFTAVVLLFKFQNLETVTVSLLSASVTLPVSVLIILVYVLGALTGGFLMTVIRTWVRHASGKSEQ